jgi:transcriptional regulator
MKKQVELVQGTLDMLILKAVSLGGLHGYGVLLRLQQLTGGQLQIQQGSLYPALYRLERQGLIASQWGESENKRKAKFYTLTAAGRKQLKAEADPGIASRWSSPVCWALSPRAHEHLAPQEFERHGCRTRISIDAYIDDLVRSGIDRSEAERRARLEFGALEATKDECRQAWGLQWMDELRADLRLTFRTLRRNPGFAAVAILSLALGIGANTAIFGLMDAVMLRLLPVPDATGLCSSNRRHGWTRRAAVSVLRTAPRSGRQLRRHCRVQYVQHGNRDRRRTRTGSGRGCQQFLPDLGIAPVIGRTLAAYDDQTPGKGGRDNVVAVISRAFWHKRFGGDPAVVGRAIT